MKLRTGLIALAMMTTVPMAAQAQSLDFGRGGPSIDLRSNKQKQKDAYREQMAREQYRRDAYRDRYRDRDLTTGSTRRYDDRYDYDRGRGRW